MDWHDVAPIVGIVSTLIMAAYTIGQFKYMFATKTDVADLERRMVSKADFDKHEEKVETSLKEIGYNINLMKEQVFRIATNQLDKGK